MTTPIRIARAGSADVVLLPALANRHGAITGATGTGKTVTLQALAEGFSAIGVPVFMADVKGDLAGVAMPGTRTAKLGERLTRLGLPDPEWRGSPVTFWDVWGEQGHPVRATISDMGPLLLARLLNLNETQEGVLAIAFKVADDAGLALLDLKDLRALLQHLGENAAQFRTRYGNVSQASIGAIQRGLLQLEEQGGDLFFGEPMLDVQDLMQTDGDGRGVVNVLAADRLMRNPRLYATLLLWLMAELFENLPEVGDREKPKLVFFFDEAHLLFEDAPAALVEKVELVVRLIRSKGVGIYFVTQSPVDIPDEVLGQLGNRVQHALRAFTPRDQKAVKVVAETMRPKPGLDVAAAITELEVGEALVSLLDERGSPMPTERALIVPPAGRLGPVTPDERRAVMDGSLVKGVYDTAVDRESAHEVLAARAASAAAGDGQAPPPREERSGGGLLGSLGDAIFGSTGPRGGKRDGMIDLVAKSASRSVGSAIGREIVRGVLGSMLGGATRRRRR